MNNILIIGASIKSEQDKQFYEEISKICKSFSKSVLSPIDISKFLGTDKERYERGLKTVKETDLIIAEMSNPSTGQGIEIREAAIQNKPLIVIAKENSNVSGMVKGCPILKKIIYYNNIDNLKIKLKKVFENE
jgi:2'-deoxynucleoside 5'-phosphate N-hydrolase